MPSEVSLSRSLLIRDATFDLGAFDFKAVTDGDPETVWATPKPQRGGEEVMIELEAARSVSGVSLSTGPPHPDYGWFIVELKAYGQ